jgi:hypothetical protein
MRTLVLTLILSVYGLGVIANIYMIGKKREPLTAGAAVLNTISSGLLAWGVIYLATT